MLTQDKFLVEPKAFFKAMDYRIDSSSKFLWNDHRNSYLPCIPEGKVLGLLRKAHDKDGYWAKERTLANLQGLVYWPS